MVAQDVDLVISFLYFKVQFSLDPLLSLDKMLLEFIHSNLISFLILPIF